MPIVIFEDRFNENLYPLTHLRASFELKTGIFSLKEKIERLFPKGKVHLVVRKTIEELVKEKFPLVNTAVKGKTLFVNGRVLACEELKPNSKEGFFKVEKDGVLLLAFCNLEEETIFPKKELLDSLPNKEFELKVVNFPWDLVRFNAEEIENDAQNFELGKIRSELCKNVSLLEEENIFIGENCTVKPGVVLDASKGVIVIDDDVEIYPNVVIEGPCYVGKKSKIKAGAKIYEGTSIGEVCKVGGEVEESIIHAYSNKQHDGFLGHSYVSEWVNLGADTNTSDLKNDYGNVKVQVGGKNIDTGLKFVGLTIGDHSKSAINTMFNTGTVVGVASNVFGAGFPPKFIPSFSWGGSEKLVEHELNKALTTAKTVMERRKIFMSEAYRKVFEKVFEQTQEQRTATYEKLKRIGTRE
ncbi:GlmU family protein [bacterium]|nr:GlmU family protein [bacterium]